MALLKKYLSAWFTLAAWKQISIALVAGIIAGMLLGERALCLAPIGTMFIHAIQMLVVPVVVTAIIGAITSVADLSRMGRVIGKALVIYLLTMITSATLAIVVAHLLGVGVGFKLPHTIATALPEGHSAGFGDMIVNIIPSSAVQAFASNNVMQILFFSVLFALAIRLVGDKAKPVQNFFQSLSLVVFQFTKMIISLAPYGVFALIAVMFGSYGLAVLLPIVKYIAVMYLTCFIMIFGIYSLVLMLFRVNPIFFFRSVFIAMITAFTTSSSAATLPISMRCARDNLKINPDLSDVLLPLGTTLNLVGSTIYMGVATIFAANIYGIPLSLTQYVTLIATIVITSTSVAAIPGSAIIVAGATMGSVGIPLGALPIIAGVDRFNDMITTATSATGDLFAATIVAKSTGMMSEANVADEAISGVVDT